MSIGKASPAEIHKRDEIWLGIFSEFNIAEYKVGTPKNNVGSYFSKIENTKSGVGLSFESTVVAPAHKGNVRALPNPYAKNNFAAEKIISLGLMLRIFLA